MGVVNTTQNIYRKIVGNPEATAETEEARLIREQAEANMPDQEQRPQEDGPDDESSEGDPDREGNTDPGTNVPVDPSPEPNDQAEAIRKAALDQAAADIARVAMANAEAALPREAPSSMPIKLHSFKYLSIGGSKGMFHVTGTDGKGAAFTVTEDAPPDATIDDLLHYIADVSVKFG